MALLPTALGTRPRLAVEIRAEGVVAARAEDAQAVVSAVAYGVLPAGMVLPALKPGNIPGRVATVAAVKKALEAVALKERETTVVVPDAAVRVLLLDFDALPAKTAEALPVVRFRLKKLLPFDADEAVVSYQVMSTQRGLIRVLAVAVPKDVLAEYESVVREAGFEPGAVLPSTLAACSNMGEDTPATLLVNAGETAVTTAIVQGGVLLLHRTVDLQASGIEEPVLPETVVVIPPIPNELLAHPLPLVDVESSASEWARQEPVSGYGVIDDERISAQAAHDAERLALEIAASIEAEAAAELVSARALRETQLPSVLEIEEQRLSAASREVTQAVSVAAAYFEDTLERAPGEVLTAGTLGAEALNGLLRDAGFGSEEIRVREMMEPAMLAAGAATTRVPHGWIAGVRGALRS
jgi:type IV pilus assembly protein PilM